MRSKEIVLRTAAFVAGAGLGYVGARFVESRGNRNIGTIDLQTKNLSPDPIVDRPFGYNELSDNVQKRYGDETKFTEMVNEFADFLSEEQKQSGDYSQSLEAILPETDHFHEEIEDLHFQTVQNIPTRNRKDFRFACYNLNRDKTGIPLVVKLGFAQGAESRIGRPFLQALCEKVDQPIIVIDSVGFGKTSIPSLSWVKRMNFKNIAEVEKEILDRELTALSAEKFDIVGISQGGVIGEQLAALSGEKVRTLVTVSTPCFKKRGIPGFAKAFMYDEAKLDVAIRKKGEYNFTAQESFYNELYGAVSKILKLPPEMFSTARFPVILTYANLLRGETMLHTPRELSPETIWIDVLGTKDRITGYQQHLAVVRERNQLSQNNSRIHLLGDASHTYANPQPTTLAEDVRRLLQMQAA